MVDTTGKVALTSSRGQVSGSGYKATDQTSATVTEPQMITMAPVADPGVTAPSRNLIINAFTPTVAMHPVGAATSAAAASPSAPFVAVVNAAGDEVIAVDTIQFSPITHVGVGKAPIDVAFSPDGSLMVTLNSDATASLHEVAVSAGVPSFTPLARFRFPGIRRPCSSSPTGPGCISASMGNPDRSSWSPSINPAMWSAPCHTRQRPPRDGDPPVGGAVFVANSADDTISVVGIGIDGSMKASHAGAAQHQGKPAGIYPCALAMTGDAATLLAACPGTGVVWAIDTANPNGGARQALTVGSHPIAVGVTPSGAYAFVANSGDGTVSLLNVWSGPPRARCSRSRSRSPPSLAASQSRPTAWS